MGIRMAKHSYNRKLKAYIRHTSQANLEYWCGVMYGEWYGVCDFVASSVIEVCVDYGGVNVFHVCLDFGVVSGVGGCVNVCGVVCVVVCFFTSGVVCCVLM